MLYLPATQPFGRLVNPLQSREHQLDANLARTPQYVLAAHQAIHKAGSIVRLPNGEARRQAETTEMKCAGQPRIQVDTRKTLPRVEDELGAIQEPGAAFERKP